MKTRKIIAILKILLALTVAFIWGHSLMPADISSEESGFVYRILYPILSAVVGKANATEQLVRKMAHFSEYTVLGAEVILLFTLRREEEPDLQKAEWAIPVSLISCLVVSFLDETIQLFVPGRAGMLQDIWIDVAGAAAGILVMRLITFCFGKKKASAEK